MKFRMFAALALAGLTATAALAAPMTLTGTIKSIDAAQHSITLSDGTAYTLPEATKADAYKVGDKVTVTWEMEGTVHQVLSIAPAS